MKTHSSKPASREAVLDAIRRVIKASGGGHVSLAAFLASSGLGSGDIFRHFVRWKDALCAAGFGFKYYNAPVESDQLLADWGSVVRELQRLPSCMEYQHKGNHAYVTLQRRFDGWSNVPNAFLAFAGGKSEWVDLQKLVPALPKPSAVRRVPEKPPGRPKSCWVTRWARGRRKLNLPLCGVPLDFGVFRYAPTTEAGVILLFGTMAKRLGFLIETVHPAFPDCKAVRQAGPEVWESVHIEFEYQSRNFRAHGHDPEGCDLIVCWEHDWPECPVEVLALKDEIEKMKSDPGKAKNYTAKT